MVRAFIAVGSNQGDRIWNYRRAKNLLCSDSGISFLRTSCLYETEPVGGGPQQKFLNAVWEIETVHSADALLGTLQAIEHAMGRRRRVKNEPRVIDLDILSYGLEIIHRPGLDVPHPRLPERRFVLIPLSDIDPGWVHPEIKKSVTKMLEAADAHYSKP